MTTSVFDPTSLLKTGLQSWWTANSAALSSLGTPIIASDDGSPASTETDELPVVVIRLGDASIIAITNSSRMHKATVTFQVMHNTRGEATEAADPLDKLLCSMAHSRSGMLSISEGSVVGVAVDRFACRQLSKFRWRAEREVEFTIQIDRQPS